MRLGWVIAIVAAATAVRTLGLDRLPPGLWSDEANHGLEASWMIEGGPRPVFFPGNCGQEPLYKYLVALVTLLRGPGIATVRLPAAVSGSLLVLLTWVWVRQTRGREEADWALILSAFGVWGIHFSRIGFRANLGPTLGVAALLLAESHARRPSPWRGIVAGLVASTLWYTYPAFRLFPLLPALWLLGSRRRAWSLGPFAGAFFVGVAPLLAAWARMPELVGARTSMASLFTETPDPAIGILRNLVRYLGMFTIEGDRNPRHNLSGEPQLDPFTGLFFVVGLGVAIGRRDRVDRLLLSWLALQLLPGVFSVERQAPHCLRTLGVLPAPYLLAASGITWARREVTGRSVRTLGVGLALAVASANLARYAVLWPASLARLDEAQEALFGFHRPETRLGRFLAAQGRRAYLSPQLYLHWTVAYEARGADARLLTPVAPLAPGDLVVLQLHERNAWWMRDDFRKNFFLHWIQTSRVSEAEVWEAIVWAYPACGGMTSLSDSLLVTRLLERAELRPMPQVEGQSVFEVVRSAPPVDSLVLPAGAWRRVPPGCFEVRLGGIREGAPVVLRAREEEGDRRWTLDRRQGCEGGVRLRGCLLFPSCVRVEVDGRPAAGEATWSWGGQADIEPYLRRTPWGRAREAWARVKLRILCRGTGS